jgi:histidine transport system substrate-binding protein
MKTTLTAIALGLCAMGAMAQDAKTLRFGVDPTFPPFESKTAAGKLEGFDIDLGNEICARLKRECKWVESSFDGLIPGLKARKFDAILSALSVNEKRLKEIDFTDKVYGGATYVVARKGSLPNAQVASLKGKHIGVIQGSVQETFAKTQWQSAGVDVVSYQNSDLIYQDMVVGRLDGTLQVGVQADMGFLRTAQGKDFGFIGEPVRDAKVLGAAGAIGVRKDDEATRKGINEALAAMLKDGTHKKLASKYFSFDIYND